MPGRWRSLPFAQPPQRAKRLSAKRAGQPERFTDNPDLQDWQDQVHRKQSLAPRSQFGPVFIFHLALSATGWTFVHETLRQADELPLLFKGSEYRRSPTQAKKKAEIAGRQNYFLICQNWRGAGRGRSSARLRRR